MPILRVDDDLYRLVLSQRGKLEEAAGRAVSLSEALRALLGTEAPEVRQEAAP